ncbi:MAG: hypothetical protein V3T05_01305 [Myxococcota bacterium]
MRTLLPALASLGALTCCDAEPRQVGVPIVDAGGTLPARATGDLGANCADVGRVRACWGADLEGTSCRDDICLVPRPVPPGPTPNGGWRCDGVGRDRACQRRTAAAAPFVCNGDQCIQRHPRAPDDADWDCVDRFGAVICSTTRGPAGTVPGPPDPGWLCGARRGHAGRICLDLSPDLPDADVGRWDCAFEHRTGTMRLCTRRGVLPTLGAACRVPDGCPPDARCIAGHCLPPEPAPSCWVDGDCGEAMACIFGTCAGRAP